MDKKPEACESCNMSKSVFHVKMTDLTSEDKKESFHWWCGDCYHKISNIGKIKFFKGNR